LSKTIQSTSHPFGGAFLCRFSKLQQPFTNKQSKINAIRAFHKQRIMFVFYNGELHRKYHTEQSHIEWFLQEGWIQNSQDEKFNDLIGAIMMKPGSISIRVMPFPQTRNSKILL
jgi:hypothetical protein